MKIYIAVGGLGCSILNILQEKEHIKNEFCYYVDTCCNDLMEKSVNSLNTFQIGTLLEGVTEGSGAIRNIGKAVTKYSILSNNMEKFFEPVKAMSDVEIVFVTSSFGGFGSSAVFEIAEYLQALLWSPRKNRCKDCMTVAFNYNCFSFLSSVPSSLKSMYEMNTIQMVMEASTKTKISDGLSNAPNFNSTIFNPFVDLILIDEPIYELDELDRVLLLEKSKLNSFDRKQNYMIKQKSSNSEVFISYSSLDQNIADLFVDNLKNIGIDAWIASRNIVEGSYAKQIIQAINGAKIFVVLLSSNSISSPHVKNEIDRAFARLNDGLIIIPFIIEECELDEDCQYYLCRQEMFDGTKPPINERINDIVLRIKNLLD